MPTTSTKQTDSGPEAALEKLGAKEEQTHATHIHDFSGETFLHTTLLLRKKEETPALYPRPYAKILKKPL